MIYPTMHFACPFELYFVLICVFICLFIVRAIARAHGGSVDVRSDAQGTTFAVGLPDAGPPPASGEVNGESETIATGLPAA